MSPAGLSLPMPDSGITFPDHSVQTTAWIPAAEPADVNLLGNLTVAGISTFNGPIISNGSRTSNGDNIFNGEVITNGNLTISEGATVNGNLSVLGQSILVGSTSIIGTMSHTGNVLIDGGMLINDQIVFTGTGSMVFHDDTVQATAAATAINSTNHILGTYQVIGVTRTAVLSTDGTPNNTPNTLVARDSAGNIAVGNVQMMGFNTTILQAVNSVAGSLVVYGNLQVLGTTTTVGSSQLVVGTKTIQIANTAVSGSQADGAALLVGDGTIYADWTFDNSQSAWRSNISLVPATSMSGNIGSTSRIWNDVFSNQINVSNKLNVGVTPPAQFNTIGQFTANVNATAQINVQNISKSADSSSDWVATADTGDDSTNYIDMGINSSVYSDPGFTIQYPLDGYVYTNGGNLTIGTQSIQKAIVFHVGGTTANCEAGRIEGSGRRWLLNATDDGYSKLQVLGNVAVTGWINGNVLYQHIQNAPSTLSYFTNDSGYATVPQLSSNISNLTINVTSIGSNVIAAQNNISVLQSEVYANANVATYLISYTGNVAANHITTSAGISATGNVSASYFTGNGAALTGMYSVGTWTPTATFATGTATYTSSGNYIKVGKQVTAYFSITLSSLGTASGAFTIGGFLVAAETTSGPVGGLIITTSPTMVTNAVMSGVINSGATSSAIVGWTETSGPSGPLTYGAITAAMLGATGSITGQLTYISAT